MDDVTFGHSGPYGNSGVAVPEWSLMSVNALLGLVFLRIEQVIIIFYIKTFICQSL